MQRMIPLIPLLLSSLLVAGFANPWQQNFQANPMLDEKYSATQQVEMRQVEFERLRQYEQAERRLRTESTTSPTDYTPEQRMAANNRLLDALQLRERDDQIEILGWSQFADTAKLDLGGKELKSFAQSIGADVVVATTAYAGQVNRIVDYPLTSYSNYYTTVAGPRGRQRTFISGAHSTVWVPTEVTEDQFFYEAVFLRRRSAAR